MADKSKSREALIADEWNNEADLLKYVGPKELVEALALERCADRLRESIGLPHKTGELERRRKTKI